MLCCGRRVLHSFSVVEQPRPLLRGFGNLALDHDLPHRPALLRGSVPVRAAQAAESRALALRFEVTRMAAAQQEWSFVWTHGLTSSVRSETEGGWPFAGVVGLADLCPVIRYDARGHGTSDAQDNCTWAAMGSDLRELQRRMLSGRRVVLGGTSMGAAASLYAALEDPTSVAGLVIATPPTCYSTRQKFVPLYQESLELARRSGLEAAKLAAEKKTRPSIFLETASGQATFEIGWRAKFDMGLDRYCSALQGAVASDLPSKEALKRLDVPTLILAWTTDAQHPLESAELLHDLLPRSELHVARKWAEVEALPTRMRSFLGSLM